MHELGVTESILANALQHAQQANAARVTGLHLAVGQFSSLEDDSVQFYWDTVSAGTICEGARLYFRRVPAELLCQACGLTYTLDREATACPACGSERVRLVSGDALYLESIDVDP